MSPIFFFWTHHKPNKSKENLLTFSLFPPCKQGTTYALKGGCNVISNDFNIISCFVRVKNIYMWKSLKFYNILLSFEPIIATVQWIQPWKSATDWIPRIWILNSSNLNHESASISLTILVLGWGCWSYLVNMLVDAY